MSGQPTTSRGKRKLDFTSRDAQPLRGKTFYLDLPSQKPLLEDIEQELTQRGGVVEKFFDRRVRYLITNRHVHKTKAKTSTCSPLTLSPNTPEGTGSPAAVAAQAQSPAEAGKLKAVPVAYRTRGGTILASSQKNQNKGKQDMIEMARKWNIKILTPNQLMAEFKRLKLHPLPSEGHKKSGMQYKVRELKSPFMKVVDCSGAYRPLVYETEVWPLPNPRCPPGACPYDCTLKKNERVTQQLSRAATGARLTQDLAASLPGPAGHAPCGGGNVGGGAATACTARRKPGYCECCGVRYEDLKMHLQSKKHRDYATNDANFAAFAAEKGLDFATFLKTVREKSAAMADQDSSSSGNNCSVVLITPPNSPAPPPATPHPCKASSETASPAKRCIPVEKYIMAGFSSPKRGSLCIMPIKLTGKGSSTGASLPGHAPVTPTKCPDGVGGGKRTRKDSVCCVGTPSGKRQRPQSTPPPADDFVPETPEKKVGLVGVTQRSPLCNMQALVHRKLVVDGGEDGGERGRTEAASPVKRRMRCLVKKVLNKELLEEVTRDSSMNSSFTLSPGTSPLTRRAGLRTEEGVAPSTPSRPLSLVISLPLKSPSPHTNTYTTTPTTPLHTNHRQQ